MRTVSLQAFLPPEPRGDLVAAHAWQADVQQDELRPDLPGAPRWPRPAVDHPDLMTDELEEPRHRPGRVHVVIDDEDLTLPAPSTSGPRLRVAPSAASSAAGSRTTNSLPRPGPSLGGGDGARRAARRASSPAPGRYRAPPPSGRASGPPGRRARTSLAASRAGCRGPLSFTRMTTWSASARAESRMCPPSSPTGATSSRRGPCRRRP